MATGKKAAKNWWNEREDDDDDDNSHDSDEIDNSAMFDTEAHEDNVEEVQSWWGINKNAELESKKLRRQKYKEEHTNFNKLGKVILGKGDTKRFYTKPTISWSQLVSNERPNYEQAEEDEVMDEQMADAAIDDEENEYRIHADDDEEEEEDVECDSNEGDQPLDMWDIDDVKLMHDHGVDVAGGEADTLEQSDDEETNEKYVLELNEKDCMFYRWETKEDAMWSRWYRNMTEFQRMADAHKQWAEDKRTRADMERLITADGMADSGMMEEANNEEEENEDESAPTQQRKNRNPRKRRNPNPDF